MRLRPSIVLLATWAVVSTACQDTAAPAEAWNLGASQGRDVGAGPMVDAGPDIASGPEVRAVADLGRGGPATYAITKSLAGGSYCALLRFNGHANEMPGLTWDGESPNGVAAVTSGQCPSCKQPTASLETVAQVESVRGEIRDVEETDHEPLVVDASIRLEVSEPPEGVPATVHIERSRLEFVEFGPNCGP